MQHTPDGSTGLDADADPQAADQPHPGRTRLMSMRPVAVSPLDAVLASVLDELASVATAAGAPRPSVLDCGGGSGSRAVPLAVIGAQVTVVDSSIDALAILARRASEAGVGDRIRGIQADVEDLADSAGPGTADLVLVHGVLGATREPAPVLAAAAAAVRPGGYLSVVVPNPVAAVLARAFAGELSAALVELSSLGTGPSLERSLDLDGLRSLAEAAGLEVTLTQGLGAFSSSVPGAVLDGRPGAREVLDELDRHGADRSPFREIAGQLHLLARRPRGIAGSEPG